MRAGTSVSEAKANVELASGLVLVALLRVGMLWAGTMAAATCFAPSAHNRHSWPLTSCPMDRTLACGCRFLRGSVFFCDAHHEGNLIRALLDEIERLRNERERVERDLIEMRIGNATPCEPCHGLGVRAYGSTATWRGGAGGMAITSDVCDRCWGSGTADRPWPSHRHLLR